MTNEKCKMQKEDERSEAPHDPAFCTLRFSFFIPSRVRRVTRYRLRQLHRAVSGATSTEYMMIMIFVVIPIALMMPMFMKMVKTYGSRMTSLMGLPFP